MKRRTLACLLSVAVILAGGVATAAPPAPAPQATPRPPEQRQILVELAYVLGESHALRRLCVGSTDGQWYSRMTRLIALEGDDPVFRQRLIDRFNAGFQASQTDYPVCNGQSRIAEQSSAARGKTLSESLVGETNSGSVR